jgi:flagellar hook protein FlgE
MAFDSLFTGVTGLTAYQNQIDVISNNIANVGTIGFKSQRVTFQDLLYQAQSFNSAPTQTRGGVNGQSVGDGVQIATTDTNFSQGGLETTGINTDLAIDGNGFFILNGTNGQGVPSYTRDGNFSLNENGLIYDPANGLAVLGFPVQANGTISQSAPPTAIQIPFGLKSTAVGTGFGAKSGPVNDTVYDVSMGGNLDQTQFVTNAAALGVNPTLTTISTTLYDSLGGQHLFDITFQPQVFCNGGTNYPSSFTNASGVAVSVGTEWQYTITSTDGTTFAPGSNKGFIYFDQNGQFINTSSLASNAVGGFSSADYHQAGGNPTIAAGDQLQVTQWGTPAGANNASPVPNPAAAGPIGFDFSDMTALAGQATPNTVSQNGYAAGILSNISVAQDGTINGSFTNGQTTALGKIALATFQNEQGLVRIGGNQFQASANTGVAQYGFAGTGDLGTVVSGSLEQSNVSIANEFTNLILAQRSFEANSKSITTADQDLQTVLQLKQ